MKCGFAYVAVFILILFAKKKIFFLLSFFLQFFLLLLHLSNMPSSDSCDSWLCAADGFVFIFFALLIDFSFAQKSAERSVYTTKKNSKKDIQVEIKIKNSLIFEVCHKRAVKVLVHLVKGERFCFYCCRVFEVFSIFFSISITFL